MSDMRLDVNGLIAVLTIDRPPVNALASETYLSMQAQLDDIADSDSVSVLILASASARAFCAGADTAELGILVGDGAHNADARRQELARGVYDKLLNLPQPTIAALNGPAIGAGAVLASCCDMRVGTQRASFRLPEVDVGRCGGARHMMRHLPQGIVRRMYFTADPLFAEEAAFYGFMELVGDEVDPLDAAIERARTIAKKSPIALRLGKEALNASENLPVKLGYRLEQEYTLRLARTEDAREALAARHEKRAPRFVGR
jgi:enoyl-CoA hydratase/carnithine racemase